MVTLHNIHRKYRNDSTTQYSCFNNNSLFQKLPLGDPSKKTFSVKMTYPTRQQQHPQHPITASPMSQQWMMGNKTWQYTPIGSTMSEWRDIWIVENHMSKSWKKTLLTICIKQLNRVRQSKTDSWKEMLPWIANEVEYSLSPRTI